MCFNCCIIYGGQYEQEWQRWGDHPVRKDYDIIMDLGEGAFSQVRAAFFNCSTQSKIHRKICGYRTKFLNRQAIQLRGAIALSKHASSRECMKPDHARFLGQTKQANGCMVLPGAILASR
jgi:hypothetical protein